jgi:hypothetical protein
MDPMDTASSAVRMARQECAGALSVAEVGMAAYMSYIWMHCTPSYNRSIPLSKAAYMSDGCRTPRCSRCIPLCVSMLTI